MKTLSKSSSVTSFVGCEACQSHHPTRFEHQVSAAWLSSYLVAISRTSIVHDNVQTPELLVRELDQRLPVGLFGDVCSLEFAFQFAGCLLSDVFGEVCDDDFGALLLELGRDAFAETAASAGDDGDFAVEFALGHVVVCERDVLLLSCGLGSIWVKLKWLASGRCFDGFFFVTETDHIDFQSLLMLPTI